MPEETLVPNRREPVLVAIVDDGVQANHDDLQGFLWQNPLEVPGNGRDDDDNGLIDDVSGWDFGDDDPDANPPSGREDRFSHGTHLAALITGIFTRTFGEQAADCLRILPIKTLSDDATHPYLKDGYRGIDYALNQGADIILCAWNLSFISESEKAILDRAVREGVLVVASTGNFPQESESFPAAHPGVLAVSAHDDLGRKSEWASYGSFIDLTAPGEEIPSARAGTRDEQATRSGSSQAAALVAGAAGVLMARHPEWDALRVRAALINGATTTTQNPGYAYRLGSGKLNLQEALQRMGLPPSAERFSSVGWLPFGTSADLPDTWTLGPFPGAKGIRLSAPVLQADTEIRLLLRYPSGAAIIERTIPFSRLEREGFVPADQLSLTLQMDEPDTMFPSLSFLNYRVVPVDVSRQFASGLTEIREPCTLEDGSGPLHYAPGTDAKWQIVAPEGHKIRLRFRRFSTEALVDKIYLFNGRGTQERIVAVLSGNKPPPVIESWSPELLLWFVSDLQNQEDGWEVDITFFPDK